MSGDARIRAGSALPVAVVGAAIDAEDLIGGAPMMIDWVHHHVHMGDTFQASFKTPEGSDIADNAALEILISPTNEVIEAHTTFMVAAGGDAELEFWEQTETSDDGTGLDERNMRRRRAGTNFATIRVFEGPTITVDGIRLHHSFLPGGAGPAQFAAGGTAREDTEWVLALTAPNYLIRVINRSGSAQPMSVVVQWYEHQPLD
jgi:hypothetical protein